MRATYYGTCLVNGQHTPGSEAWRECPQRKAARTKAQNKSQKVADEAGRDSPTSASETVSSSPADTGTSSTVLRDSAASQKVISTGRAFRPGRPRVSDAQRRQKARDRQRRYRADRRKRQEM